MGGSLIRSTTVLSALHMTKEELRVEVDTLIGEGLLAKVEDEP